MVLVAGVIALSAGALAGTDVEALQQSWSGVFDTTEQVVATTDNGVTSWPEGSERRVRTIVKPVTLPWLGPRVLYLEEFLQDDPDNLRRELLVKLEPAEPPVHGVRAHLYTFNNPRAWIHLNLRPKRLEQLTAADLATNSGCDLLFTREGKQFRGALVGHRCLEAGPGPARYLDYQVLLGENLYWYRRRTLRRSNGELLEEVVGFNWFELDAAQLYTCRIDWADPARPNELRPLMRLELQDQGGRGSFVTPDGRKLELTLHSDDWPYASESNSLILILTEQGSDVPLASAWSGEDTDRISLELGWLRVRCGAIAPNAEDLLAART